MISKNHSNRRHRNWLIYNIYDEFLQKYSAQYKGVLYDLGCGESPYKEFFLEYAGQYVVVEVRKGKSHEIIAVNIIYILFRASKYSILCAVNLSSFGTRYVYLSGVNIFVVISTPTNPRDLHMGRCGKNHFACPLG